jgi:hypothetical protein
MTDVFIARLSAAASTGDQPRVHRLLHDMADRHLDSAIASAGLPPGEWCVRRLDVPVRLDAARADAAVQTAWAEQIAAALTNLLRQSPRGEQVVHYPRTHDALADLLATLAAGRTERAWAWRQLALLEPGDPDPQAAPGSAALAALHRRPARAIPALIAAIQLAGTDALHRLLGSAGWTELSRLIITLHRGNEKLAGPSVMDEYEPPRSGPPLAHGQGHPTAPRLAARPDGQSADGRALSRLASTIWQRSLLALAFARGHIRPNPGTAWAWAVLAAAEAEPALFARPEARSVLAELARRFAPARPAGTADPASAPGGGQAPGVPISRQDAGPHHKSTAGTALTARATRDEAVPAGQDRATPVGQDKAVADVAAKSPGGGHGSDIAPTGWPTRWAGLPFFLATAAEAGLPDAILSDRVLAERPLSWTVYQLGRRLLPLIDASDPAPFALAGLVPGDEPQPPETVDAARLGLHADRWARVTAARLGRAGDDASDVAGHLASRTGSIVASPGWIEVHLDLADVDIDVRRAGLDLDPGWVPWLGAVVIFVYE